MKPSNINIMNRCFVLVESVLVVERSQGRPGSISVVGGISLVGMCDKVAKVQRIDGAAGLSVSQRRLVIVRVEVLDSHWTVHLVLILQRTLPLEVSTPVAASLPAEVGLV